MARQLTITSRHRLGVEAARDRLTQRFEALKTTYMDRIGAAGLTWSDNVGQAWATSLGQRGTARIVVNPEDLIIEIRLPLLLSPLSGFLKKVIDGNADALKPETDAAAAKRIEA